MIVPFIVLDILISESNATHNFPQKRRYVKLQALGVDVDLAAAAVAVRDDALVVSQLLAGPAPRVQLAQHPLGAVVLVLGKSKGVKETFY